MKNINIKVYVLMALLTGFIMSCGDLEVPLYSDKTVTFLSPSASLTESLNTTSADGSSLGLGDNSYVVTVVRSTTDLSQPLTVNVNMTATYLEDTDFANAGDDASSLISVSKDLSALVIPAGNESVTFTVRSLNDDIPSGNKSVTFEIASVSDNSYKIGQQVTQIRKSLSMSLVDDDCPIDLANDWEGEYQITSFCAAEGSNNEGFCRTDGVKGTFVMLTADSNDPLKVTAIISGGIHAVDMPVTFIPCLGTAKIVEGDYELSFLQNGSAAFIRPTDEADTYGTGTFDPDSKTIELVFTYSNAGNLNFDEFIAVYQKVQ